jgi:cytidylate kinase
MTIAISRPLGTPGLEVAQHVGAQLHWPVFDRELLQRIADELHVRVELLETLDERPQNWLLESLEAMAPGQSVSEFSFLHRLVATLYSLAAHGECVIVGRGAAQVLPAASTLRVRLVAPREARIEHVSQQLGISRHEAQRRVADSDRDRVAFVKEHFQKDPEDPLNFDLVLNTQSLKPADCAAIIVAALAGRDHFTNAQKSETAASPATPAPPRSAAFRTHSVRQEASLQSPHSPTHLPGELP